MRKRKVIMTLVPFVGLAALALVSILAYLDQPVHQQGKVVQSELVQNTQCPPRGDTCNAYRLTIKLDDGTTAQAMSLTVPKCPREVSYTKPSPSKTDIGELPFAEDLTCV
jgi:hypothetical protein